LGQGLSKGEIELITDFVELAIRDARANGSRHGGEGIDVEIKRWKKSARSWLRSEHAFYIIETVFGTSYALLITNWAKDGFPTMKETYNKRREYWNGPIR